MIVVLLGPPGSGKGTQARKLWTERSWPQLSTGDMLRRAIEDGTALGLEAKAFMSQGALVPDSVVIGLIQERTQASDCSDGFVLDGFPRNIAQAQALDQMLSAQKRSVSRGILFEIPDEDLVRRLSGRRTCSQCGALYHIEGAPPKEDGKCDQCQSLLFQREDDQPEVIKKRLAVYHHQTEPLVGFYRKQEKLQRIDATRAPSDVCYALAEALK